MKQLRLRFALLFIALLVATATLSNTRLVLSAAEAVRDLAVAPPESVGISSERLKRIDAGMKAFVDNQRVAGVTTLLSRHGKTVHSMVAGTKDIRTGEPLSKDSIFRIYSMTKPVTSIAMMMLFEEGKWRIDDPVSRYIPEFASLKVHVGTNPDGTAKLEDVRRPGMTMRQLLTHSAGLGYILNGAHPVNRGLIEANVLDSTQPLQRMIDILSKTALLSQPGTQWSYSIGVDVQGYLIEKMSGMTFAEFLEKRLFAPLGMKDTGFYVPKEKRARLALVHNDAKGKLMPPDDARRGDPTVAPVGASGGGGLFSTAADYMKFCEMLLNGGQFNGARILAPRTVEMIRTNHLEPEALATMRGANGWGLGFSVVMDPIAAGDPSSKGTYWWYGIAGTWFFIDPVEDLAFIGMIQHDNLGTATEMRNISRNLVYQAVMD
jgi:CubicO group peptidase (beta-lactamase class C family)